MKEWNKIKEITELAQISLVFHFINKLHLNTVLNTTYSNVHRIKSLSSEAGSHMTNANYIKQHASGSWSKYRRASLIRTDQIKHCSPHFAIAYQILQQHCTVDLGRVTEYLHDSHSDDCLTVIHSTNIKFHLTISPCLHVLYQWMHNLNFQLLIIPPPPALLVTQKMQVRLLEAVSLW